MLNEKLNEKINNVVNKVNKLKESSFEISYEQYYDEIISRYSVRYLTYYTKEPNRIDIESEFTVKGLMGKGLSFRDRTKSFILETNGEKSVIKVLKEDFQSKITFTVYEKTGNILKVICI